MENIVYKPFKKKLSSWNYIKENQRQAADGRTIMCIEIGKKQYIDPGNKEVIREEFEQEEVYYDILKGLFKNTVSYSTKVALGHEPKLIVSYEGSLVKHNDKIAGYVEDIKKVLPKIEKRVLFKCLFNVVMNEKEGDKYSTESKELSAKVNKMCGADYPSELIAYVLKEYLSETRGEMDNIQEKTHFMEYRELMTLALKVMVTRGAKDDVKKYEDVLKEELLYRFLLGEIS